MENQSAAYLLVPLLVAVITALGAWLWNRHKPQVDRNVTTIDGFDKLATRVMADNDDLREQLGELRTRMTSMEGAVAAGERHARTQDGRIGALQRAVEAWTTWGHWLHAQWQIIRQSEQPPDLPTTDTEAP